MTQHKLTHCLGSSLFIYKMVAYLTTRSWQRRIVLFENVHKSGIQKQAAMTVIGKRPTATLSTTYCMC